MTVLEPLLPALGLAVQASAVADTVVTVAAASTGLRWWVELMTSIATIVIALALIAIAIPLIPAAWNSRKMYGRVNDLLKRVENQVNPILRHANEVADNVNYVTTAVRQDVAELKVTIDRAEARLENAAAQAEERINEFNALLKVVQEEAEDLFIDTASTLRGVRAGATALRSSPSGGTGHDHPGPAAGPRRNL